MLAKSPITILRVEFLCVPFNKTYCESGYHTPPAPAINFTGPPVQPRNEDTTMNAELETMSKALLAGVALGFVVRGIRHVMLRRGWRPKPARAPQPSRKSSIFFFLFFGVGAAGSFVCDLPWGGTLFLILAVSSPIFNEVYCRRVARNQQWSAHMRRFAPHVITERLPGISLSQVDAWQTGWTSPPEWEQPIILEKLGEPPTLDSPVTQ